MAILETQRLTKTFREFRAVDGLTLSVEKGEVFGLLGPNGAGKSTTIKMLTTLLEPTSGDALVDGVSIKRHPARVRAIIGYVPQLLSVDAALTGYENLLIFAKLYDIPSKDIEARIAESLEFMGLGDDIGRRVSEYSGGMIRRLEIAQSMLHHPTVLFLDEPTTGLDPIARKHVWEHIEGLRDSYGVTILMTTHLMEEADALCDRVALLSRGKLAAVGDPDSLKESMGGDGVSLEDVFIHYTSDSLVSTPSNYREISRERKRARRLG